MKKTRITKLGKFLRKLRIDNEELLYDMSRKLNISPSQLSSIEIGNKLMSDSLKKKLIRKYNLNFSEIEELSTLINEVKIPKKENMDEVIRVRSTSTNKKELEDFCKEQKISNVSELIRLSLTEYIAKRSEQNG